MLRCWFSWQSTEGAGLVDKAPRDHRECWESHKGRYTPTGASRCLKCIMSKFVLCSLGMVYISHDKSEETRKMNCLQKRPTTNNAEFNSWKNEMESTDVALYIVLHSIKICRGEGYLLRRMLRDRHPHLSSFPLKKPGFVTSEFSQQWFWDLCVRLWPYILMVIMADFVESSTSLRRVSQICHVTLLVKRCKLCPCLQLWRNHNS